nr:hypothetical protein [Tanacetum cinerariifolium]
DAKRDYFISGKRWWWGVVFNSHDDKAVVIRVEGDLEEKEEGYVRSRDNLREKNWL